MSNEFRESFRLSYSNTATLTINPSTTLTTYDQTNSKFTCGVQNIGTTSELLAKGDIGSGNEGILYMQNLDDTNYIQWGYNDAGTLRVVGRIPPNEYVRMRVEPSGDIRCKANTAACD